jgi:hypothetical protein
MSKTKIGEQMISSRKKASSILLMAGAALSMLHVQAAPQKKSASHEAPQKTTTSKASNKKTETAQCPKQPIVDPAPEKKEIDIKKNQAPRTIKITNSIEDRQLAYNYCFVSYSPTSFNVQVNGKTIDPTKSEMISISDNKITVRYDYAFLGGKRKGCKEIEFEIDPGATDLSMNFSWNKESRIVIDKAKPVIITKIY